MPNWCSNVVTMSHTDIGQVERARDAFLADKLMQTLVPCPTELHDETPIGEDFMVRDEERMASNFQKFGYRSWYEWHLDQWGTKWDVSSEGMSVDDYPIDGNSITISFDSAWSPPIAFYQALEEQGWTVDAFYHEPGMEFCGRYTDGDDDCYDLSEAEDSEWVKENIPDEINEMFNISGWMEDSEFDEEEE